MIYALAYFTFLYPLVMSLLWLLGAILFKFLRKNRKDVPFHPHEERPPVSVLIPCHNEEQCIRDTIHRIFMVDYPDMEVIAIDDASKDRTLQILEELQQEYHQLRIVRLMSNRGKAAGLTAAATVSKNEYLICIDADAILDKRAIDWMVHHLHKYPRVGAVTGNPKVRNRNGILSILQIGEFACIVGMIKRTQRLLGKVFTVSGVVVGFRKRAILDAGFWSTDMVTEDIDISWKLQLRHWDIRYEPRALCWILCPDTLGGILKQRIRWAQGGCEVILRYWYNLIHWKHFRLWFVYLEYLISVLWCVAFIALAVLGLAALFIPGVSIDGANVLPANPGVVLGLVCLVQFCVGVWMDSKYDPTIRKLIPWLVWFPMAYWVIVLMSTIFGLPKALFKKKGTLAVWESPDRGIKGEL